MKESIVELQSYSQQFDFLNKFMKKKFTFWRGIAVAPADRDSVMAHIREQGLSRQDKCFLAKLPSNLSYVRQRILTEPDNPNAEELLWPHDSDDGGAGVYVSGSPYGATYYATSHNYSENTGKTAPLLIRIEADIDHVHIDGRDFLFTAFQGWDQKGKQSREVQREVLAKFFGPAAVTRFDRACANEDKRVRISEAVRACVDPDVVAHHYGNRHRIAGRYGTLFESAFVVQLPVRPDCIIDVTIPDPITFEGPHYSLTDFFAGRALG